MWLAEFQAGFKLQTIIFIVLPLFKRTQKFVYPVGFPKSIFIRQDR